MNLPLNYYIVRSLKSDGTEVFYTGRAGDGFIGQRGEAFAYSTQDAARAKASNLNRYTALHGYYFIAMATERITDAIDAFNREAHMAGLEDALHQSGFRPDSLLGSGMSRWYRRNGDGGMVEIWRAANGLQARYIDSQNRWVTGPSPDPWPADCVQSLV